MSVSVARDQWKQLGLGKRNLTIALDWMHNTFKDAPVLGSLLNPAQSPLPMDIKWEGVQPLLEEALKQEQSDERQEAAVVAQGLAKAATLLAGQYQWVITNVPYLARGKQSERLRNFCERYYPEAKNDLATVFLDRCLELATPPSPPGKGAGGEGLTGGTVSVVLPQNWLFLTSYKKFREKLLKNDSWHLIARLGPAAFETISGEVVKAILIAISRGNFTSGQGGLFGQLEEDESLIRGMDVSDFQTAPTKATQLIAKEIKSVKQGKQLENPDAIVTLEELSGIPPLGDISILAEGLSRGDMERYDRYFWELDAIDKDVWGVLQNPPDRTNMYSGRHTVFCWENGRGSLSENPSARVQGFSVWGEQGVFVARAKNLKATLSSGHIHAQSGVAVASIDRETLPALWAFIESSEFNKEVRALNSKVLIPTGVLSQIPFNLEYWFKVAQEKYPNGLPQPYTDDPTQWISHGHPCGSVVWGQEAKWTAHAPLRTDNTVLQVAVAHLLGYRWPAELDADMELADEQREWVRRCDALLPYADKDGIVCIPPVRGEASAADRLLNLLAAAYGDKWSNDILAELLKNADHADKTLETWLRDKFFAQHCKLFQHRPFIWHVWDGLRDGFAAMVNYHKLDRKNLETLIYTYLGDWISRQKQDRETGVDGAEERLAAAESLKKKLEQILEGEQPYDIFVRWKPLEQQPVGWNPDLNDGVRLNIRPFMKVGDVKKKGAGLLRDKPNINWKKDRGKDVESAPWYHVFKGERINDHHLTLAEKKAARETAG